MAILAKVGTFNCPAATGNSGVTSVGFQPQAVIFFYNTRTTDGSSPNAQVGVGMATATTERFALGIESDDNVNTSVVQRAVSNAHCIRLVTNDAATTGLEADFVSFDADGFTLNWTIVVNGADIHYLALGGLTNAKVHGFTLPTATGSQAKTGVGFQPNAALFMLGSETAAAAGGADVRANVSAADGTASLSLGFSQDDFSGNANGRTSSELSELMRVINPAGTLDGTSDFTSFDADGFTFNCTDAYVGAYLAAALCLRGLRTKIGSLTLPAATGSQGYTGVGFQPKAILFFGNHNVLSTSIRAAFSLFVGGASASTERAVISTDEVFASDPLQSDYDSDTTKVIKALTGGTPTTDYAADLTSFDVDGFTLNWTTVGTGASSDQVTYMAFGSLATGGARSQTAIFG